MKPQLLALMTAIAWGVGGYFEKQGLHQGGLSPQMGITIRTAVALVILALVSFPQWKALPQGSWWRSARRSRGDALFLCCHQGRSVGAGHADRFHFASVRRADGDHAGRRAPHRKDYAGNGADHRRNRPSDHGMIGNSERLIGGQ
jgi:hypothetical protein